MLETAINFLLIMIKSSIPIGATSFGLVWWALRQGYLGDAETMGQYEQWQKAENKQRKEEKKRQKQLKKQAAKVGQESESLASEVGDAVTPEERKHDLLHSKWMKFGGGFYGVVAFFTYMLIELAEVRDFFSNFADLFQSGLISMVVHFFIESLRNFISAIAWPAYWMKRIHADQWLWILGAYGGYWLGSRAAFKVHFRFAD